MSTYTISCGMNRQQIIKQMTCGVPNRRSPWQSFRTHSGWRYEPQTPVEHITCSPTNMSASWLSVLPFALGMHRYVHILISQASHAATVFSRVSAHLRVSAHPLFDDRMVHVYMRYTYKRLVWVSTHPRFWPSSSSPYGRLLERIHYLSTCMYKYRLNKFIKLHDKPNRLLRSVLNYRYMLIKPYSTRHNLNTC